ncbi:MAG: hypothetical protein KKA19_08230 [Candidatus Margulisbacteria bacterium]|nr:hypothetical protein [Candidatus Margulisiibacteriota bacterium]
MTVFYLQTATSTGMSAATGVKGQVAGKVAASETEFSGINEAGNLLRKDGVSNLSGQGAPTVDPTLVKGSEKETEIVAALKDKFNKDGEYTIGTTESTGVNLGALGTVIAGAATRITNANKVEEAIDHL